MQYAFLPLEPERNLIAINFYMLISQGGKAVGSVFPLIVHVPHPDQGFLHDSQGNGGNFVFIQRTFSEIAVDLPPDARKLFSEFKQIVVFVFLPGFFPVRMVNVLLPSPAIDAGSLQVSVGIRTDPDFGPGGRYHQGGNPATCFLIPDPFAFFIEIGETRRFSLLGGGIPNRFPRKARLRAFYMSQSCHESCFLKLAMCENLAVFREAPAALAYVLNSSVDR